MKTLDVATMPLARSLVEASAGTGKTWSLAALYLRLVAERGYLPRRILVVTFTNAATAELRTRIRERLRGALAAFDDAEDAVSAAEDPVLATLLARDDRDELRARVAAAVAGLDEASIHTIHGFCQRALSERAFESGARFDANLLDDEAALRRTVANDVFVRFTHEAPPALLRAAHQARLSPAELVDLAREAGGAVRARLEPSPTGPTLDVDAVADAARDLADAMRREGDRLLALVETAELKKDPGLAARAAALDLVAWSAAGAPLDEVPVSVAALARPVVEAGRRANVKVPLAPSSVLDAAERYRRPVAQALEHVRPRLVVEVLDEVARRKRAAAQTGFDDLLVELGRALEGERGVGLRDALRAAYDAALVDEFQDTDPVQYRVFDRLFGDPDFPIVFIGDPKQAIYSFRGADVHAYLEAARAVGDARTYSLATSYRSDPAAVGAVNALFDVPGAAGPFRVPGIRYAKVDAARPARLVDGDAEAAGLRFVESGARGNAADAAAVVARACAAGASLRLEGRPLVPGDFAVLTRTNAQARQIQAELRALAIPSVLHGDASVFEGAAAEEVLRVLEALAAPGHGGALRRALATVLAGFDAGALAALETDPDAFADVATLFRGAAERFERRGIYAAMRGLFDALGAPARVLARPDGERYFTDATHVVELLHAHALAERVGLEGLAAWLASVRGDAAERAELAKEDVQVRLESDAHAVQVATIHQSKGLEYPIVVLPFLGKDMLLRSTARAFRFRRDAAGESGGAHAERVVRLKGAGDDGAEEAREAAKGEAQEENLRLAYVALTRSRHQTVVLLDEAAPHHESALAWLLHRGAPPEKSDPQARAALRAQLGALSPHVTYERSPDEPPPPLAVVRTVAPERLAARALGRPVVTFARTSSFTGLSRKAHALSPAEEAGVDRDEDDVGEGPSPAARARAAGREAGPLADFPRGRVAGHVLHLCLETLDFAIADDAAVRASAEAALLKHGLPPATWGDALVRGVQEVLATPLHASGLRLRDVPFARTLRELEFWLPVGEVTGLDRTHGAREAARLTARRLGDAFASDAHGLPWGYADAVRALDFEDLAGHLRGFMDLVLEHDGRYWLVDHKSNYLGPRREAYTADRLVAPMAQHHYVLQYHLYLVALDRHLRTRLAGYDYERHVGGALYLFLRGMHPDLGARAGVFFDKPSAARLRALDRALGGAP